MSSKEIVIGAAQFGSKYGITNNSKFYKKKSEENIKYLINRSYKIFDTSNLYNDANLMLGKNNKNLKIYCKFSIDEKKLAKQKNNTILIKNFFNNLFKDLKTNKIFCMSFHTFSFNKTSNRLDILKYLKYLKKIKKIKYIGVSINTKTELKKALNTKEIDLIQLPYNILEHRWDSLMSEINKAKLRGKKFQVRSIFLQGLLLTSNKKIWKNANCNNNTTIIEWLNCYKKKSNSSNLTTLLINYIFSLDWIDSVVIGMNTKNEIIENIKTIKKKKKLNKKIIEEINFNKIKISNKILNPTNWKL